MKYTMRVPCADCPFRREGGIRLTAARVREITTVMLTTAGGTRTSGEFPCHKSVDYETEPTRKPGQSRLSKKHEIHCAGALIFAEKNETPTQMMRLAERLGMYDAAALMGLENKASVDGVFDDQAEMLDVNQKKPRSPVKPS